jgi:microsomal dipeptidase-like Zn-dependent dipeptidase
MSAKRLLEIALVSIVLVTMAFVPTSAQTFTRIQFTIGTGGDDLRGDSTADATLMSPNGTVLQIVPLKTRKQGGWGNTTTHVVSANLTLPRLISDIGHIVITLQSHNGFLETNDNWNVQRVFVGLSNGAGPVTPWINSAGNPLARLTGDWPSLVLDNLSWVPNAVYQPVDGRLLGYVDLHTHPLANLGFGGKLFYGGVDVGSLLPADPDGNRNVRATSMQQALGHDGATHGFGGINNGDLIRQKVVDGLQKQLMPNGSRIPGSDAPGAPNFKEWPTWADVLHQKMWVEWIRRAYTSGLRVMVALAVNNKTLGDITAGPGDYPTDDKTSADLQLREIKLFVGRHTDFMEVAYSSADLNRIVRSNRLAIVLGIEIDNPGNLNRVKPLTQAAISTEINRLFGEGVRYIFPIHLLDNPFGGTAAYEDLMNYSNYREAGYYWDLGLSSSYGYMFSTAAFNIYLVAAVKAGTVFPKTPNYNPGNLNNVGEYNKRGLTPNGAFAIKEMMRHGMLIDIDHMSDRSKMMAIEIAISNNYPLNSGHSGLRSGPTSRVNERSTSAEQYRAIALLHGMAGVGCNMQNSDEWAQACRDVLNNMPSNDGGELSGCIGFGTDTNGISTFFPPPNNNIPRIQYTDAFPRSSLGTKWWNYNYDGVAHYGMLADFLQDILSRPNGRPLVKNLMQGANYFYNTWLICETKSPMIQ